MWLLRELKITVRFGCKKLLFWSPRKMAWGIGLPHTGSATRNSSFPMHVVCMSVHVCADVHVYAQRSAFAIFSGCFPPCILRGDLIGQATPGGIKCPLPQVGDVGERCVGVGICSSALMLVYQALYWLNHLHCHKITSHMNGKGKYSCAGQVPRCNKVLLIPKKTKEKCVRINSWILFKRHLIPKHSYFLLEASFPIQTLQKLLNDLHAWCWRRLFFPVPLDVFPLCTSILPFRKWGQYVPTLREC